MNVLVALEFAIQLSLQLQQISQLVSAAHAAGRDTIAPEDWAAIFGENDAARARLEAAIKKAESEGR